MNPPLKRIDRAEDALLCLRKTPSLITIIFSRNESDSVIKSVVNIFFRTPGVMAAVM